MRNQIVILAGGKGTRMGNTSIPKVLVMLKNKPLILHLLEEVEKINQLVKPIIVVGYMGEKVKAVLGDNYLYALQDKQLGTAHALLAAKYKVTGENILVLYGDHPFIKAESLKKLMALHHQTKSNISLFTTTVPNFEGEYEAFKNFGRIIRENGKIIKNVEAKDATLEEEETKELIAGIYMFNTSWLWQNLEKIQNQNTQNEYYLTDIVKIAIDNGENLQTLAIEPLEVYSINSQEDLNQAEKSI